ncbi:MAG: T9SS type A sorting domain-containing protein [Saprospiraceae bacterium]
MRTSLLFPLLFLCAHTLSAQPVQTIFRMFPSGKGNAEKIQQIGTDQYLVLGKDKGYAYALVTDKKGKESLYHRYRTEIGGKRSEFTDAVTTPTGYLFIGDCDACNLTNPLDTARKVMFVETDKALNIVRQTKIDPPADPNKRYRNWGYQYIRHDSGNDYIALSQVTFYEGDSLRTDFVLTKVRVTPTSHDVLFHNAYHVNQYDNIADLQVTAGNYVVMNWGVKLSEIGSDTTSILQFSKTGELNTHRKYRGVGQVLLPVGPDWIIGGSQMDDIFSGPQSMLTRIDGESGAVKAKTLFGGNKVDAIKDVKLLPNGTLLVASNEDCDYPDLATSGDFILHVYAYPDSWPQPKTAKIRRMNANTFTELNASTVFSNPGAKDVIIRSLVSLNNDGTQFVSCGQFTRRPMFYSIATQNIAINNNNEANDTGADDRAAQPATTLSPNPAKSGSLVNLSLDPDFGAVASVSVFDMSGRRITQLEGGNSQLTAPEKAGLYFLQVQSTTGQRKTLRLVVTR